MSATRRRGDWALVGAAAASLLVAGAIYVLFRGGARLHQWAALIDPAGWLPRARAALAPFAPPPIVRYSAPDALWQFAFCALVFRVQWGAPRSLSKALFCAAPVVIGIGCELGQAIGWVEGVFDSADLALSTVAIGCAIAAVWVTSARGLGLDDQVT